MVHLDGTACTTVVDTVSMKKFAIKNTESVNPVQWDGKMNFATKLAMSVGMDINVKIGVDIALQMTVAIPLMVAACWAVRKVTLENFAALGYCW